MLAHHFLLCRSYLLTLWSGGAAHLPGMTASMTPLPVLGVPVKTRCLLQVNYRLLTYLITVSTLNGQDSLLSIVQMPRGIPVGTLAIGDSGAANAAILAASFLATHVRYSNSVVKLCAY